MLYLDLKHKIKSKFLQKTSWFVSSGWVAHKVLICVISFKSTGQREGEFVRLQQGFKAERDWRANPPYYPVYFITSLERERNAFGTAIYKAPQQGWESKCPQCAEGPQSEVCQGPHSPALFLCLQTVPHHEIGDTWCHPPAAQSSCTFTERDKNNSVSV